MALLIDKYSNGMKLSIVIPVYNVEKYIRKCLDTVIRLPLKTCDFEIIVVDDGTPDNSMSVVKNYESLPNLHVISQYNKGLGGARNTGLCHSKGEWVYFLDSDDYIDANLFATLFQKACNDDTVDIIIGDYFYVLNDEYKEGRYRISTDEDIVLPGERFLKSYYSVINTMVWRSIYRRSMLLNNDLFFTEGVYHEDINWTPKCIAKAKKVYYSPMPFYYYLIREGSIIQSSKNDKKVNDLLVVYGDLLRHFSNYDKTIQKCISDIALSNLLVLNGQYGFYRNRDVYKIFNDVLSVPCSRNGKMALISGVYRLFPGLLNIFLSHKYGKSDSKAIF